MIAIVLWSLAAVLILLIAAASLPLQIRVSASSSPRWRIQVHTTWLGGLTPPIRVIDSDRWTLRRKAKEPPEPNPRRWARRLRPPLGLPTLIGDLLGRFRITDVKAEGEFGFADPADTGAVFGMLAPLVYGGPHVSRVTLDLRPVFERPCLSGKLDAIIMVTPAALIPPVLRFAWRNLAARSS